MQQKPQTGDDVRVHGEEQGYQPLIVKHIKLNTVVDGEDTPVMETCWYPTPADILKLLKGAPFVVQICGTIPAPMMVDVGEPEHWVEPWLIIKAGYYYRPNRSGYTKHKIAAGRYTAKEAKAECEIEPWHMHAVPESEGKDEL